MRAPLLLLVPLALILAGCAGEEPSTEDDAAPDAVTTPATEPTAEPSPEPTPEPTPASADAVSIDIEGFTFIDGSRTVPAGTVVTWTNQDAVAHTVTADDGSFDSGSLAQGATYTRTFDEPGSFPYHCTFHPSMQATITVEA